LKNVFKNGFKQDASTYVMFHNFKILS